MPTSGIVMLQIGHCISPAALCGVHTIQYLNLPINDSLLDDGCQFIHEESCSLGRLSGAGPHHGQYADDLGIGLGVDLRLGVRVLQGVILLGTVGKFNKNTTDCQWYLLS